MIEVVYKEEKQDAQGEEMFVQIPRNIRQIGLIHDHYKIYMEDYVYTFLKQISQVKSLKGHPQANLAVLTGETKWWSGITYLFIRGALLVEEAEAAADHIDFSEEIWTKINEEQKKYFEEQEIVGWFFSQPQFPVQMTELFAKIHLKYFGGEKVLMLMEPIEKEEAFFRYDNGYMAKQSGYYIYYQKNPSMQAYMMEKIQKNESETVEDEAVKKFRKMITEKKTEETKEKEGPSVFSYAATACLVIAALTVGVNFYHNYLDMNEVSQPKETASSAVSQALVSITPHPSVTPMPTVTKRPEKTVTPAVTEEAQPTLPEQETAAETTDVYQEEADVRKAKRREALENQNAQPEAANQQDTQAEAVNQEETQTGSADQQEGQPEDQETASSGKIRENYVIRPGDTLYQISMERYGSMEEIQEICKLNGMNPEEIIYPGQVIVLP